jgi:GT2 family glycosyltransferase
VTTSVLIVTYRATEAAIDCLTSLTAGADAGAEVIVVDNASGDGTAERIAARFPRVRLIEAGENLGFARAVNLAAGHATGDVLVLLNPDTIVHDGAIGHLAEFARAHPDAGLVGGRTLTPAGDLDPHSCWGVPSAWSMVCFATGLSTLFKHSRVLDPESLGRWQRDSVREVGVVSGCLLAVRREVWDQLGGFDPSFFMYGEDVDLSLRAARLGYRPLITPRAVVTHIGGASSSVHVERLVLLMKGKVSLMARHGPAAGRALLAAGVALRAATCVAAGARDKGWPALWRRRREWLDGYPNRRRERTLTGREA